MIVRALVLAFLLTLLLATPASGQFEDWAYEVPIVVQTANGGEVLRNHWVPIEDIHSSTLQAQSFMRSDADDVRFATALGQELPVFAQSLDSDTATWWVRAPVISEDPKTYFMHLGSPTAARKQSLGLSESDRLVVADDASLESSDSLLLESLGTRVDELPTETGWLLHKPGAYGLGIRPSGNQLEVFGEVFTGAATSIVSEHTEASVPNGDGSLTSASVETEGCDDTSKHDCVDDPVGIPDTDTYLHTLENSGPTDHTASALPDANGDRDTTRIVANECLEESKWQCVDDATDSPDTSTYLAADATENLLPDSDGDATDAGILAAGCPTSSKWQCVNDGVAEPDEATSYLYAEWFSPTGALNMVPDSNGDETDTGIVAVGCTSSSKWQCVDDPVGSADTTTYLYTAGVTSTGSATMRPNGGYLTDSNMHDVGCTNNYQCIDDAVGSPDDTDYLWAGSTAAGEVYNLTNVTIPNGATITAIQASARVRGGSNYYSTWCRIKTWLRTGSSNTSFEGYDDAYLSSNWHTMNRSWTTEPDGSAWDASDLLYLKVGLSLRFNRAGSGTCRVSQLYVTVYYRWGVSNPIKTVTFNLETPPAIPTGASISQVSTGFVYNDNSSAGTCSISTKLRLDSTDLDAVASVNANPTTWTSVTGSATANPGGGSWAASDLANLQVGLNMRTLGGNSSKRCFVTQLYIAVHYTGATDLVNKINFGLFDFNSTWVPAGATIEKIATHFRYMDENLATGTCEVSASLRIGGAEPNSPIASVDDNPTGWTSVTGESTAKPDGNAWTLADLDNLQIVLSMRTLGGVSTSQCRVTQLYAVVDFSESIVDTATHEISFALGNPTIPANAPVQKVVTHFRYDYSGTATGSCIIGSTLRLRGSALNSVSSVSAKPTDWTDVVGEATTKPGGEPWLATDIPDLEVGLRMRTVGQGTCKVTQVYAVVHYDDPHSMSFGVSVPVIPVYASIEKVGTHFRYKSAGAESGVCNINSTLHLEGSELDAVSSVSGRPTTWTVVEGDSATRPGGGAWTAADIADLELGLRMGTVGSELNCMVTQIYATTHYSVTTATADSSEEVAYSPLRLGTSYDIAFEHDGANISLSVDGAQEATRNVAPVIPDTGEDLVIGGGWTGLIEGSRLSSLTGTVNEYVDQSGNGNNLAVSTGGHWVLRRTNSGALQADRYLHFSSEENYLQAPSATLIDNLFAGGGTLEFCGLPALDLTSQPSRPIGKTAWGVQWKVDGDGRFGFMHGYSTRNAEWSFPAQDESWHCYAIAYDRDQGMDAAVLYIDGQPASTTIVSSKGGIPEDDTGEPLRVGNSDASLYAGSLGEVRLWNDIRTSEEVAANWNTTIANPSNAQGLVGYWPLDNLVNTIAKLDLEYEATHTTETQKGTEDNAWNWLGVVDDQSSSGNDAAYFFPRNGISASITKSGLALKSLTQPVGSSITNPDSVAQPTTDESVNVPILGLLVSVFSDVAGIDHTLGWTALILLLAVGALVGVTLYTGEPTSAMFAAGLVLAFGAAINVVSWIVLILYVVLSGGLAAILLRRP